MAKYRKKPVLVKTEDVALVITREGQMTYNSRRDASITFNPDTFEQTHEKVE